jgi:hypothetical protein
VKRELSAMTKADKESRQAHRKLYPYDANARSVAIKKGMKKGEKPGPRGPRKDSVPPFVKKYRDEVRKHDLAVKRVLINETKPPAKDTRGKKRATVADLKPPPKKSPAVIRWEEEQAQKALAQEADEDYANLVESQTKREEEQAKIEEDGSSSSSSSSTSGESGCDSSEEKEKKEEKESSSSSSSSS